MSSKTVVFDIHSFILHVIAEPQCVSGAQSEAEGLAVNMHTASTLGKKTLVSVKFVIAACHDRSQVRWHHACNSTATPANPCSTARDNRQHLAGTQQGFQDGNSPASALLDLTARPPALVRLSDPAFPDLLLWTL